MLIIVSQNTLSILHLHYKLYSFFKQCYFIQQNLKASKLNLYEFNGQNT